MLIRYPRRVMVNKENCYREYKSHTKWISFISSHLPKNVFGVTLLHAHAHHICVVCAAKYERASLDKSSGTS